MTRRSKPAPKSTPKPAMVRQGDVLLLPVEAPDAALEPAPRDPRGLILAEGESSGHHHALFGYGAKLMRFRDTTSRRVAVVERGGELRVIGGGAGGVDRHLPIAIAPGRYEIRIQRAWTSAQRARQVQD